MSEIVIQIEHANIYQSGNLILQDVNLNMQKGEFVYLVGKTGTGKSSLLKTLYGELTLTEGLGHVAGFNLKEMDWKKLPFLRRNLGVVFQDFQLLSDRNVNENLSFVLKATGWQDDQLIQQKIDDVLRKVGLQNKGFKMTYEMSGGEQQRVAVARALINNPDIVFADEPTGNLDSKHAQELHELFLHLQKTMGQTFLIVTHNETLAKMSDRVVHMKDGYIVEAQ